VYTGFRPAFVIYKRTDAVEVNWQVLDSKRDIDNPVDRIISKFSDADRR
jgi:hypothetical protein